MSTSVNPGDKFGQLEVLERVGSSPRGAATYRCKCHACGEITIKEGQRMTAKRNPIIDCGCRSKAKHRDISGETHGSIQVLHRLPKNSVAGDQMYQVRCLICGRERAMPKSQILSGPASCGCRHYTPERMASMSALGVQASIVDGVNINAVFKGESNITSKTGVRGVFPERRKGILTGTYRASVMVHGERIVRCGFLSIDSAKKWRDEAQKDLIEKYNVNGGDNR